MKVGLLVLSHAQNELQLRPNSRIFAKKIEN